MHDAANSIATIVSTRVLAALRDRYGRPFSISSRFWCSGCMSRARSAPASSQRTSWMEIDLRRIDGRDLVESDHAVLRHPVKLVPCADRRPCRWRRRGVGFSSIGVVGPRQDQRGHRAVSPLTGLSRAPYSPHVLIVSWIFRALDALRRRSHLSHRPVRFGVALFARPWRQ